MLTIVAIPKPFGGVHDVIQRNAIRSWHALPGEKEIVLIGDASCEAIAAEVGATLITDGETDAFGTPLVSDAVAKAHEVGKGDVICLVNADIIMLPGLIDGIEEVRSRLARFLVVARRWNVEPPGEVEFTPGWEQRLRAFATAKGVLFAPQAIDLFAFPRGLYTDMPPFAIGRSYYDNWIVDRARRTGVPVVDGTERITLIHQNHVYTDFGSMKEIRESPQGRRNFYLAGDSYLHIATTRDATHTLGDTGLRRTSTRTVSVIIPHRGPAWRLQAAIRSIIHQSYPRTFIEIVIADNDPNGTLAGLRTQYPFVKVCHEPRPGPGAARNYGAACATGDILAFLDSDCVPTRDWITEGVKALSEDSPGTSVVAGAIEHTFTTGRRRSFAERYSSVLFHQQQRYVEGYQACAAANVFVTRESFWRVGGFDEDFPEPAGEDWDWAGRAAASGMALRYAPAAKVLHPTLGTLRQVRAKLKMIARGNALQWTRLRSAGESDPRRLTAVGAPGLGLWSRRIRQFTREKRLTFAQRCVAIMAFTVAFPALRREWRRAAAGAKARADGGPTAGGPAAGGAGAAKARVDRRPR